MAQHWYPLHKIQTALLQKHCDLLAVLDQPLFQSIQQNQTDEELFVAKTGNLVCCHNNHNPVEFLFGEHNPEQEKTALHSAVISGINISKFIVVLGASCGVALQPLVSWVHQNRDAHVLWIEPNYARVAAAMRFVDVCPALASGRMHIVVNEITEQSVLDAIERFQLWEQPAPFIYKKDFEKRDEWITTFGDLFERETKQHQQRIQLIVDQQNPIKENNQYNVKKILLVDCWKNAAQQIHLNAIEQALQKPGIEYNRIAIDGYRIDLQGYDHRRQTEWKLMQACEEFQPNVILSYAYHAPHIMRQKYFDAMKIPWLQVVSNLVFHDNTYYENEHVALCETRLINEYQQRGANNIGHIPIMANYCVDQLPATNRSIPILFVGNSLGLHPNEVKAFWKRIEPKKTLTNYVQEALHTVGTFDQKTNLFDWVEKNPIPQLENRDECFQVYRFLLCQTTQQRRIELLESIANIGLHIYGNWLDLKPGSPLHSCMKGYLPIQQEPELYKHVNVAVNIHSTGHVTSPNMRFFNSPGLGAMQITDGNFESFLKPDHETVYYQNVNEFREKVEYYLHYPNQADEIRQQALSRIQNQWTYSHWLQHISQHTAIKFPV